MKLPRVRELPALARFRLWVFVVVVCPFYLAGVSWRDRIGLARASWKEIREMHVDDLIDHLNRTIKGGA